MARITTAIEIKRDVIRAIQVKGRFKELTVVSYEEERLPFAPSLELEENIDLISSKLHVLLERLPLKVKNPVMVIPTQDIMVRFFDLPYLPPKERSEAVKYEAQKYIPFTIDEIISDFYIPHEIKGKEMRVVFMAVKEEVVDKYLNIASNLGLKLLAIEPYPFSLMRALFYSGDLKLRDFVLIVDLDHAGCSILVTQGLNLYIARDFVFSTSFEFDPGKIVEKVIFEVNRTMDYVIKEFPHQPVKEIIVTGEAVEGIERERLSSALNINVKIASLEGKASSPGVDLLKRYVGLIGAAMRGQVKYDVELDFFADYKSKVAPEAKLALSDFIPKELIQDVILVMLGVIFLNFYLGYEMRTIKEISRALAMPERFSVMDEEGLKEEIKEIRYKIGLFNDLLTEKLRLTHFMNFLSQSLPSGVWLERISLEHTREGGREINIEGYGYDKERGKSIELIYDFLEKVNTSAEVKPLVRDVKVTNVEKTELMGFKVVKFNLRIALQ